MWGRLRVPHPGNPLDKKVAATEADLGLIQASDAYDAVAKQLKASAFVGGKVTSAKKPKATLTVRGADR